MLLFTACSPIPTHVIPQCSFGKACFCFILKYLNLREISQDNTSGWQNCSHASVLSTTEQWDKIFYITPYKLRKSYLVWMEKLISSSIFFNFLVSWLLLKYMCSSLYHLVIIFSKITAFLHRIVCGINMCIENYLNLILNLYNSLCFLHMRYRSDWINLTVYFWDYNWTNSFK